MMPSLYTAASGMIANQLYVDSISNNLSNVNTTGFKKSKLQFQDLLYQTLTAPGASNSDGVKLPGSLQVGLGVKPMTNDRIFLQGNLQNTGNDLDIAVQGDGFFQLQKSDGTPAYTRDGTFKVNADGLIVNAQHHHSPAEHQPHHHPRGHRVGGPAGRDRSDRNWQH